MTKPTMPIRTVVPTATMTRVQPRGDSWPQEFMFHLTQRFVLEGQPLDELTVISPTRLLKSALQERRPL